MSEPVSGVVVDPLPPRGVFVLRGSWHVFPAEFAGRLAKQTGLTVVLLPEGADFDIIDLDTMRSLGWMPVPIEEQADGLTAEEDHADG